MDPLQIAVLGPVEVHLGDRAVALPARKEQMVLAALAASLNHTVSTHGLVDALWLRNPPKSALDTVQSIVSRLRSRLGHDSIESIGHSYRLVVEPDQVDAVRFECLTRQASALLADDPSTAASLATDALALWRGPPFGDLNEGGFLEPEVQRLEAMRLSAVEVRLEADVACGRLSSAVGDLRAEIARNPYRERLWYLLVLALARDGCRVGALRACQQLRSDLVKIGLEPSADICELEQMVVTEAPEVRSQLRR